MCPRCRSRALQMVLAQTMKISYCRNWIRLRCTVFTATTATISSIRSTWECTSILSFPALYYHFRSLALRQLEGIANVWQVSRRCSALTQHCIDTKYWQTLLHNEGAYPPANEAFFNYIEHISCTKHDATRFLPFVRNDGQCKSPSRERCCTMTECFLFQKLDTFCFTVLVAVPIIWSFWTSMGT